jgi:hypothetical protein
MHGFSFRLQSGALAVVGCLLLLAPQVVGEFHVIRPTSNPELRIYLSSRSTAPALEDYDVVVLALQRTGYGVPAPCVVAWW